jgi:hypothetical protein
MKLCFNVFVNIFQIYFYHKGSRTCKRLGDIIQNNVMYFDDFLCVEIWL